MNREFTIQWDEISESDKVQLTFNMVQALKVPNNKSDTLKRIFDLAKPGIVLGRNESGAYCRLSPDSKEIVELLMKNYF